MLTTGQIGTVRNVQEEMVEKSLGCFQAFLSSGCSLKFVKRLPAACFFLHAKFEAVARCMFFFFTQNLKRLLAACFFSPRKI